MIRELFEDKSKQSKDFDNDFKISLDDAKKLAKNYGQKWYKVDKDVWTIDDADTHVFTFMPRKGELYTDFDEAQVIDMIKG